MSTAGFVTAGGRSARMGCDKSWLQLAGRPMIERVTEALAPAVVDLAVIANSDEYSRLPYQIIRDQNTGVGPLEAFRVALANTRHHLNIIVACDLPFVTTSLFRFLLKSAEGYDAVIPSSADGKVEPLCSVLDSSLLPLVSELISRGHRKVTDLFDRANTRIVGFEELSSLPGSDSFFTNVNTPEDYERVVRRCT
jgi:molybdopterin-guanine dinucleotide biosynthesis protein A